MRVLRLVPLLLAAAGCGAEFTPRSVVVDTRVLAIVATPLELGPDDPVTLTAWRIGPPHVDPAADLIEDEHWSFCPFSIGSTAGYVCAVPECEEQVTLAQPALATAYGPSNPLTAPSPRTLVEQCLALLSSAGALPAGVPSQFPDKVEVLFRYKVTATGSREREAVQRIPVYLAGVAAGLPQGQDPNVAPTIVSVEIGGIPLQPIGTYTGPDPALRPGADLPVRVVLTPESAQTYYEGPDRLTEQLVVSFYTTAGRFDYDWANGPDASVKLKGEDLPAGATEARLWVVARDLRGGETVEGPFRVAVAP